MNQNPNSSPGLLEGGRPPCLGQLFPDFSKLSHNETAAGCAFDARVESCGIGVQRRAITFKPERWAACSQSPHFDECYRLSMAKLLLDLKLDRYT